MNSSTPQSHFARHLAQVSDHTSVEVMEDMVSVSGAVIAKSGTVLSNAIVDKITKHPLSKNIELMISLSKTLTGSDLLKHLVHQRKHDDIKGLMARQIQIDAFERECSKMVNYPLILQKLTVLKIQMSETFDNAVMGAYIALLIGAELKLDPQAMHAIFLASLCRDVGYLHIDPELLSSDHLLSPEEWHQLQAHVLVSHQFVSIVPSMPASAIRAVLEHHERTDGLGYPRQLLNHDLAIEGQIVAFADMAIALFNRYVGHGNYTINALEPVFQVNTGIHTRRVTRAALRVLNVCFEDAKQRRSNIDIGEFIPQLLRRQSYIRNWFEIAKETNQTLSLFLDKKVHQRASEFIARVQTILVTSGIADDLFMEWLKERKDQTLSLDDVRDIEEFAIMLNEAAWQFNHAYMMISVMIDVLRPRLSQHALTEVDDRANLLRELLNRFYKDPV